MKGISIKISGNLLSESILDSLVQESSKHLFAKPESFRWYKYDVTDSQSMHFSRIAEVYDNLKARWDILSSSFNEIAISDLREKWIKYLFLQLGYNLEYQKADVVADSGNKFCLSYRGWVGQHAPIIHTVLFSQDLDQKPNDGRHKHSPHDTLQRYLNQAGEDAWAIVTNGKELRILRDFHHETRQAYVEFDLESIFEGRNFNDFRLLWRLIHPSRFIPNNEGKCALEILFEESKNAGVSIGEYLQKNVRLAIEALANGFLLSTPGLGEELIDNNEKCLNFYQQSLRVIYRILFLFYAEQRKLMPTHSALYAQEYSLSSLREKIESRFGFDNQQTDLWEGLKVTFKMVYKGVPELGITAFNGQLFSSDNIELLNRSQCRNDQLLETIKYMSIFEKEGLSYRISYVELSVDEIGAIYESLLEYIPRISSQEETFEDDVFGNNRNRERQIPPETFFLDPRGTNRKTSGSYYTNSGLVNVLIESALVPALQDKLKEAGSHKEAQEKVLLSLKVCDPACGSAAFLIAATEYLGEQLAKIRTQNDYPSDVDIRHARRDVLRHCIYGVDINPMSVELAKVSLWLTVATSDQPLNFLDHHIKCGNSLIGSTPELLKKGIPPEAYSDVEGDDKDIAKNRIKVAKDYYKDKKQGQMQLNLEKEQYGKAISQEEDLSEIYEENSPDELNKIEEAYREHLSGSLFTNNKFICDYWAATFFWPQTDKQKEYPGPDIFDALLETGIFKAEEKLTKEINRISRDYKFFHWHLEFPEVFANGGFDCILGNPPWEKNKPNDKEFFTIYSNAKFTMSKSAKEKAKLKKQLLADSAILTKYEEYKILFEFFKKWFKFSGKYLIQGAGDINLYKLFFELNTTILKPDGYLGIILPGGVLGSAGTREIRSYLFDYTSKVGIIKFNQWANVFHGVAHKVAVISLQRRKGMEHLRIMPELMSIAEIDKKEYFSIPIKLIKDISPTLFGLPNIENNIEKQILLRMHQHNPLIEKIKIMREIDMTIDAKHFVDASEGLPIWDGRQIFCLKNAPNPKEYIDEKFYKQRFKYTDNIKYKTVIRNIIPDSAKKVYSSILPGTEATSFALRCLIYNEQEKNSYEDHLYLASVLSSFVVEWRILKLVNDINLATFLPDVPIPLNINYRIKEQIIDNARIIFENNLEPKENIIRFSYINALVATLFNLTGEELKYIMDSFDILKKNEIKEFKEYLTGRLISEKYQKINALS